MDNSIQEEKEPDYPIATFGAGSKVGYINDPGTMNVTHSSLSRGSEGQAHLLGQKYSRQKERQDLAKASEMVIRKNFEVDRNKTIDMQQKRR